MKYSLMLVALFMVMGMPMMHGLSGKDFGKAVSELARMYPGAVAEHVGN